MIKSYLKLSFLFLLVVKPSIAEDSFSLNIKANACSKIEGTQTKYDAKFKASDKAILLAVKNSSYIKSKNLTINDYDYTLLSYKIADRALINPTMSTTLETKDKVCMEVTGLLDKKKTDEILKDYGYKELKEDKIKEIVEDINQNLPKSIYEADDKIPLLYIKDLEFYTNKTTTNYTNTILEELSFVPRILVTDKEDLADFYIVPKMLQSSIDVIDDKNSRFSMSVKVEIRSPDNTLVQDVTKNRYIIIENTEDNQQMAQKMLNKLLKEALSSLKDKLSILFLEK